MRDTHRAELEAARTQLAGVIASVVEGASLDAAVGEYAALRDREELAALALAEAQRREHAARLALAVDRERVAQEALASFVAQRKRPAVEARNAAITERRVAWNTRDTKAQAEAEIASIRAQYALDELGKEEARLGHLLTDAREAREAAEAPGYWVANGGLPMLEEEARERLRLSEGRGKKGTERIPEVLGESREQAAAAGCLLAG